MYRGSTSIFIYSLYAWVKQQDRHGPGRSDERGHGHVVLPQWKGAPEFSTAGFPSPLLRQEPDGRGLITWSQQLRLGVTTCQAPPCASHVLTPFILTTMERGRYCYSHHLRDESTENRSQITVVLGYQEQERLLQPGSLTSESHRSHDPRSLQSLRVTPGKASPPSMHIFTYVICQKINHLKTC